MILLVFGMTGEMIYSVAGLLGLTGSARMEEPNLEQLTLILLTVIIYFWLSFKFFPQVHVTRILQVMSHGSCKLLIYIYD